MMQPNEIGFRRLKEVMDSVMLSLDQIGPKSVEFNEISGLYANFEFGEF